MAKFDRMRYEVVCDQALKHYLIDYDALPRSMSRTNPGRKSGLCPIQPLRATDPKGLEPPEPGHRISASESIC